MIKFFLTIIFIIFSSVASAQVTQADRDEAAREQQRVIEQQQRINQQLMDRLKQEDAKRKKPSMELPKQDNEKRNVKGNCFNIKEVNLEGASKISSDKQKKLTEEFIGQCLDFAGINEIIRKITNYYFEHGYIATKVLLPEQNIKSGKLKLTVIEGVVNEIILNENNFRDKTQVLTAFPYLKGKVFNLRDFEQGMDQINRLSSNNATMEIVPGEKIGTVNVVIKNISKGKSRVSLGYNNFGQESTGEGQGSIGFEQDNLLGINDLIVFNASKDVHPHSGEKLSENVSGSIFLPYGYYTVSGSMRRSKYLSRIHGVNQDFTTNGVSTQNDINIDRVVFRDQNSKLSFGTGMTFKDQENYLENAFLSASSQNLSIINVRANYTLTAMSALWMTEVGYSHGIDIFGASKDASGIFYDTPRAQFDRVTASLAVYKPFEVKGNYFNYNFSLNGQYSNDHLYSSEQIGVGGFYSIRGFKEDNLFGDSGVYARNEISYELPQFIQDPIYNEFMGSLKPYAAFDYGYARQRGGRDAAGGRGEGYMSGYAIGLRNNSEKLDFDLSYSKSIVHPYFIDDNGHQFYATVTYKFKWW